MVGGHDVFESFERFEEDDFEEGEREAVIGGHVCFEEGFARGVEGEEEEGEGCEVDEENGGA